LLIRQTKTKLKFVLFYLPPMAGPTSGARSFQPANTYTHTLAHSRRKCTWPKEEAIANAIRDSLINIFILRPGA